MNNLFESVNKYYSSNNEVTISSRHSFSFTKEEPNDDILKDIKSVEVKFNNGESIFISAKHINKFNVNLVEVSDVIDNPLFKHGYIFNTGIITIDKVFLHQMLGDDLSDKLMYRGGVNSLIVEYNNDYKIKSNIPLMLCLSEVKSTPDYTTKMKYDEDDYNFIISWVPVGTL